MYTVGIKLLLSASFSITNFFGKRDTGETTNSQNFYGKLDLDTPAAATNSAHLIVSGDVRDYDELEFYINKERVKKAKVSDDGTFAEEIGELDKGSNDIIVRAIYTKNKKYEDKQEFTITYSDTKPKLDITEPTDNSKTNNDEIKVAGSTDIDNTVRVNGFPVVLSAEGKFETTIRLKDGDNTVEVTAEDTAGNMEKKSLKVTYSKDD
jgi:uncharacterized protein YfaP (DUF2135 family)